MVKNNRSKVRGSITLIEIGLIGALLVVGMLAVYPSFKVKASKSYDSREIISIQKEVLDTQ